MADHVVEWVASVCRQAFPVEVSRTAAVAGNKIVAVAVTRNVHC
jgi:hypothetical protein